MFGERASRAGRSDPGSWVWRPRNRSAAEGERATLATDPTETQERDGVGAFRLFVELKLRPRPGATRGGRGGESRSPALTSQAGGRCKPANGQLSIRQEEAGLQGSAMATCGVSVDLYVVTP